MMVRVRGFRVESFTPPRPFQTFKPIVSYVRRKENRMIFVKNSIWQMRKKYSIIEQRPKSACKGMRRMEHDHKDPNSAAPDQAPGGAPPPPQYYAPYNPYPNYTYRPQDPYAPDPLGEAAARTAMILGILALFIPCVGFIFAIIAIVKALEARRLGSFSGEATAGMVCGIIGLVLFVLVVMLYTVIFIFSSTY
jgi:hypothetical protein